MFGVHRPGGSRYAKKARFAHRPRKAGANMTVEEREMIRAGGDEGGVDLTS